MKEIFREISIEEIEGFRIGNAQDAEGGSGCTVIICEKGAVGGVDVRGGGPASRETDLLDPQKACQEVYGVLLSGGSAFGLDAAGGVMRYLEEREIGFDVGIGHVPIVPAACLFDLTVGDPRCRPDAKMGYAACVDSENNRPQSGNFGAGTGATVGKFMEMDDAQRQQIVKMAAYAAAAGPVLLVLGKVTKGIGSLSTGVGKFATAVSKAGGGWKGFFATLSKSPAMWLAVAAAVVTATATLVDYVSGAKQAREALEAMQQTAEDWKNTAAETFYNQSEGLSFFGLDSGSFTRETKSAREWLQGVLAVWTDGKKETNEIVREWTDSFKKLTASTRSELEEMRETAQTAGYTSVADQLSGDIDKLDAMDAEISRLLKKRQNGYFSDKDKIRLQELIDAREAIEVKYHLSAADTDGFEQIGQKLQAEIARAQAAGKPDADVTVYENAVKAAAEGMGAINTQLAEQYDKEFALIQLISDETERQQALDS